jgi:hypothetical protein
VFTLRNQHGCVPGTYRRAGDDDRLHMARPLPAIRPDPHRDPLLALPSAGQLVLPTPPVGLSDDDRCTGPGALEATVTDEHRPRL